MGADWHWTHSTSIPVRTLYCKTTSLPISTATYYPLSKGISLGHIARCSRFKLHRNTYYKPYGDTQYTQAGYCRFLGHRRKCTRVRLSAHMHGASMSDSYTYIEAESSKYCTSEGCVVFSIRTMVVRTLICSRTGLDLPSGVLRHCHILGYMLAILSRQLKRITYPDLPSSLAIVPLPLRPGLPRYD
jgi:hypothetical protein